MAWTATRTKDHRDAIMAEMCMDHAVVITHSADRPNSFLEVCEMPGKFDKWMSSLRDGIELMEHQYWALLWTGKSYIVVLSKWHVSYTYEHYDEVLEDSGNHDQKGNQNRPTESLRCFTQVPHYP